MKRGNGPVFAWGMYDFANTAFSALFVTFFYPFFVKDFLGGDEFQIGLVFGGSMLLVALIVPIVGAFSDQLGRRKPFIIAFTILCCLFTALVSFTGLVGALVSGFFANFSYHGALATYNALLPSVSNKKNVGFVSGIGVGLGYLGTLASILMAVFLLSIFGWETLQGTKSIFIATAIFFFLFSLITFFFVKEKTRSRSSASVHRAIKEVTHTIKHIRSHKPLLKFLLSLFFTVNAINAVIVFLYLYGRSVLGMTVKEFMLVYALFSLSAVVGSVFFGKITDKFGPKRTLTFAGLLWLVVVAVLFLVSSYKSFVLAGLLGGVALGTVWTAARPLLISLSPKKSLGEFFGFSELTDKFSGVIGPVVFGFLASKYSYHSAILSLIVFFVLGLVVLQTVPYKRPK